MQRKGETVDGKEDCHRGKEYPISPPRFEIIEPVKGQPPLMLDSCASNPDYLLVSSTHCAIKKD